jgi:hypothetical protein
MAQLVDQLVVEFSFSGIYIRLSDRSLMLIYACVSFHQQTFQIQGNHMKITE